MEYGRMDESSDELHQLARELGVETTVWGGDGVERNVSPRTLVGVLGALGVAVSTPEEIRAAREEHAVAPWRRLLPAVVVVREGADYDVPVFVPQWSGVSVWITCEDGSQRHVPQRDEWGEQRDIDGRAVSRTAFILPTDLPLGWHTLHADNDGRQAYCSLVVTPQRLATNDALAGQRNWGLMAQLYSVRSSRSWGIGDFADLADLAAISGAQYGAGFVLVNPLHAAEPAPPVEPSPYLPTTRRFFHPLYIRVEDVAEYAYLSPSLRRGVEALANELRPANFESDRLDRDSTYTAKLAALRALWQVPRSPARQRSFAAYREGQGKGLEDYALWCALTERFAADAPEWTTDAAGPASPLATTMREELAEAISFHCWLQWICDQQLENAQRSAEAAGMAIGIVHDLAVGVHTHGSDAWTLSDVLAQGVTVGAPPDMFNQQGQNWSQPPWHPWRLEESGYAAYRDMLRGILRHAGGIRVDHVLGLFRLWWIPEGTEATDGAYVHYDHEALIGILVLEAQRAGAIVIGEDLGIFEPWVRDYLAERAIFGTSILWFERYDGQQLAPELYREQCLTSVNTHDLPPTAGYLAGDHVSLRESLGLLGRPVDEERAADAAEKNAVLALVRSRGLLSAADEQGPDAVQRTVEALYAFTAKTPSLLLGVALVDAVGERRTQNQPGTENEYPNWRVPLADSEGLAVLIDDLPRNERFASLVRAARGAD